MALIRFARFAGLDTSRVDGYQVADEPAFNNFRAIGPVE
jgi:hypothetical protein